MFKNNSGNFAYTKFTNDYVEMSAQEIEAFNKFGADAFIVNEQGFVLKEDYQAELEQKERERLDNLSMTRGDVFEALILAKGLDKPQIRAMIEQAELDDITKALYLNRFDEALEFYRGYPIFNLLGEQLDITSQMLDEFFETKDYKKLIAPAEEEPSEDEAELVEPEENEEIEE